MRYCGILLMLGRCNGHLRHDHILRGAVKSSNLDINHISNLDLNVIPVLLLGQVLYHHPSFNNNKLLLENCCVPLIESYCYNTVMVQFLKLIIYSYQPTLHVPNQCMD